MNEILTCCKQVLTLLSNINNQLNPIPSINSKVNTINSQLTFTSTIQEGSCDPDTGVYKPSSPKSAADFATVFNSLSTQIKDTHNDLCLINSKLTFNPTILQGTCDPKTGLYKATDPAPEPSKTFTDVFKNLSNQIKDVHNDLCNADNFSVIIPDEYINFSKGGYYLILRWALASDVTNTKYWSLQKLYNPIAALTTPDLSGSKSIWSSYFGSLSYVRGVIPCRIYAPNTKRPFYSAYCQSKTEGTNLINKIIGLTQQKFGSTPRIQFNDFSTSPYTLANAGKTFTVIRAKVIQRANSPTDIATVINDFYPPKS